VIFAALTAGGDYWPVKLTVLPERNGPGSGNDIRLTLLPDVRGGVVFLDENHAQALVLALQAAIAEVQARAVSL